MIEYVFEDVSEAELIDVTGEATRDESTAIAQRLLAVGEFYARRAPELAETFLVAHRSDRGGRRGDLSSPKHQSGPRGGPDSLWTHVAGAAADDELILNSNAQTQTAGLICTI